MLTLTARRLLVGAIAASLMIAADTAFAQYASNIRVLKLTDYLTAFYDGRPEAPPPKTDKPRTWIE